MSSRFALKVFGAVAMVAAVSGGLGAYTTYSRWAAGSATFRINTGSVDPNELTADQAVTALRAGMDVWNTQSGSAFRFYYGGTTSANQLANDGVNAVFFRQATNGGAIATTYSWWDQNTNLIDSDIVFWDQDRIFHTGTSGCVGGAYVEDIAAHEFGHALGLNHSDQGDATMYPSYGSCSQGFRTLSADDVAGARALYPGGSTSLTNTAPVVGISSPADGASYPEGTYVTLAGSASDSQDGNLSGSLQWSDNSGYAGTGSSVSRQLMGVGTHVIVAHVTDSGGLFASKSITINVTSTTSGGTGGGTGGGGTGPTLTARGRKVKGLQISDLWWSGFASGAVDVYRDGMRIMNTANDGAASDSLNRKGSGTYTYKVCDSAGCSNVASVVF